MEYVRKMPVLVGLLVCSLLYVMSCTPQSEWVEQTYSLTFMGNDNSSGTVPPATSYSAQTVVSIPGNISNLLKINVSGVSYRFAGWNTKADGTGAQYTNDMTVTMASNITLYADWVPYVIGDIGPGGGMIFYDNGEYTNGWRYMEVELTNLTSRVWGSAGTNFSVITSTNIGEGYSNTIKIIAQDPYPDKAADECAAYTKMVGGIQYDDWFLPSLNELIAMYDNLQSSTLLDFVVYTTPFKHWSSSQFDSTWTSYFFNFAGTGGYNNDQKDWTALVRPARRF